MSRQESHFGQSRRTVLFEGCLGAPREPAAVQLPAATGVGDRDAPLGYLDSQMHALNAIIALRDAKALSLSLGSPWCFGWPVLWSMEYAFICGPNPDGEDLDYVDTAIMPRMVARSLAIPELLSGWDNLYHCGEVPGLQELASHRPRALHPQLNLQPRPCAAAPPLANAGCKHSLSAAGVAPRVLRPLQQGRPLHLRQKQARGRSSARTRPSPRLMRRSEARP